MISSGSQHSCALTIAGKVRCWGFSSYGQLGYGSRESAGLQKELGDVPAGGEVIQIAAGTRRTCALFQNRTFRCWGDDPGPTAYSDVAEAMKARPASEHPIVNLREPVMQIASGGPTCALLAGGAVRCWGDNEGGQLGYGHKRAVNGPAIAEDIHVGGPVVQIAIGRGHTCVLLQQGRVRCWGFANSGPARVAAFQACFAGLAVERLAMVRFTPSGMHAACSDVRGVALPRHALAVGAAPEALRWPAASQHSRLSPEQLSSEHSS